VCVCVCVCVCMCVLYGFVGVCVQQGAVPPTSSVPPVAGAPSVGQPGAGFGMVSDDLS
jgi:hypothetical protein